MANRWSVLTKKSATSQSALSVTAEEVARMAYQLFEQRGRVHGNDLDDWLRAEEIVRKRARQRR